LFSFIYDYFNKANKKIKYPPLFYKNEYYEAMNQEIEKPSYGKAKEKLIKAATECLMKNGTDGVSVRKICAEAGVSVGLINYHYPSLQNLIADAYKDLALSLLERAINSANDVQGTPEEKLSKFLQTSFDNISMNRRTLRAWIVFWGMIESSSPVKEAHDIANKAFEGFLENLFEELNKQTPLMTTPRLAAIGLTAMQDGLWLEFGLQSGTFTANEAHALCELWINSIKKN